MKGRALGQVEVEGIIEDLIAHLEALTTGDPSSGIIGFDEVVDAAASAEVDWKVAFAKAVVSEAVKGTPKDRKDLQEHRALIAHEPLYRAYKISGAQKEALKEALTTTRSKLDAMRTIAANIRSQT